MTRKIVVFVDPPPPTFSKPDGVEVYHFTDEHSLDMDLLNDLVIPLDLVFVGGGDLGKSLAKSYHGNWVSNV